MRATAIAILALLAAAAPAGGQSPPPTLTTDLAFAPTTGIARTDFTTGIVADMPFAVAVAGDRIYTVGRTQGGTGGQDFAIVAHRASGGVDPGFSEDGRLVIPLAAQTKTDTATGIVVLPDGRLRVVGATDVSATSTPQFDIAVVGLLADGSPDPAFGTPDPVRGTRRVVFPAGPSNDAPSRIVAGADGRLAIAGARSNGTREDLFVALLEPDGTPVGGFGTGGVQVRDLGGAGVDDRGVDVEFRPGGGLVALAMIDPLASSNATAVLRAFTLQGADDPAFSQDGVLALAVGDPDTVPGGLVAHAGRLWVAGATRVGVDNDAFLARVEADGSGLASRRFDLRGAVVPANQPALSRAFDLTVVPGTPATLVAVGSVDYGSPSATDWGAAAFNDVDGDLAAAGFGDVVLQAPGNTALLAAAAAGERWLAVAGNYLDNSDNSFGTARLLLDAEKSCDLAVTVVEPAEIVFRGRAGAALAAQVTNAGTRPCAGTVSVPAPYQMAPFATGSVASGARLDTGPLPIAYAGPRRAEDILVVSVDAPGDVNPNNNVAAAHVVFSYCDVVASAVGRAGSVPSEGRRRFPVSLRNAGTSACRVRIPGQSAYRLAAGQSAEDGVPAGAPRGARPGARVQVLLRAPAGDDVEPANNEFTVRPRVVGVGDSDVRRHGPRGFSGVARKGNGALPAERLRPAVVHVALLRAGRTRCAWLRSAKGTFAVRRTSANGGCGAPRWVRAEGTRAWRLRLDRALAPGRYVLRSRVSIKAGFPEARFSRADRNRVDFTIG